MTRGTEKKIIKNYNGIKHTMQHTTRNKNGSIPILRQSYCRCDLGNTT